MRESKQIKKKPLDLDVANIEYKVAEHAARQGGEGVVEAVGRLAEKEKLGTSPQFLEAAYFEDEKRTLITKIQEALKKGDSKEAERLLAVLKQSELKYRLSLNPEKPKKYKFEKEPKFKVLDNKELERVFGTSLAGKSVNEVRALIWQKYRGKLAGPEHLEYLMDNSDKIPTQIQDRKKFYFFLGGAYRVYAHYLNWYKDEPHRGTRNALLDMFYWNENYSILLVE